MTDEKALLVGLGNPGREYRAHRHNIGFMLADRLAGEYGLTFGRVQHNALLAAGEIAGRPVVMAKPQTWMNLSGQAVGRLVRFFQIPLDRLLVAYDDLDLPLGTMRFREEGGAGGHKGMRSIIGQLGTQSFARLRLGIGRPPGQMDPAEYVLRPFRTSERPLLEEMLEESAAGVCTWLTEGISLAMSRHNRTLSAEAR